MHHFVVVGTRGGVSPEVHGLLADPDPEFVRFSPDAHRHWRSASGSVHVASWTWDEWPGSVHRPANGGVVLRAGAPFFLDADLDDSRLLLAEQVPTDREALRSLSARLEGIFAVAAMTEEGTGMVVNDALGLEPLYLSHPADGIRVVSNRPSPVAAVIGAVRGTPAVVDEEAASWILLNGQFFGNRTGYRDVSVVEPGTAVAVDAGGGMELVPWRRTPTEISSDGSAPADDWLDRAERRMVAVLRGAVALEPDATSCELTGGRDSRMNLDLASIGGQRDRMTYHTFGGPATDDFLAADAIATTLGLDHRRRMWPIPPEGPSLAHFVSQVRDTAGQSNCWELSTPTHLHGLAISGLAGESLRTNYAKYAGPASAEEALGNFDRFPWGRHSFVRDAAWDDLRRRARDLFAEPLDHGVAPADLFDVFYVVHRLRRWVSGRPDKFHRYAFPLYSPSTVDDLLRAGWESRVDAVVHAAVRRHAALPIDDIDFEKGPRWTKDPGANRSVPRPASPPEDRPVAVGYTRQEALDMRVDAIRAAVEHDPANPAFEVVDPERMTEAAARYADLDRREQIELHQALTFVLWLGLARPT